MSKKSSRDKGGYSVLNYLQTNFLLKNDMWPQ